MNVSSLRKSIQFTTAIYCLFMFSNCTLPLNPLVPELQDMNPKNGIPGTIVELKGMNFNPVYHRNSVTIGDKNVKVISATSTSIRVVLLRDLVSGPVIVTNLDGMVSDTSSSDFIREGSTLQASPLVDSDAELIQGLENKSPHKFDMAVQGNNQPILIVLAQPMDITNPDSSIYFDTSIAPNARDYLVDRAANANTYFQQASNGKTSADFVVTPDWVPLSQVRDFYFWGPEDRERAQVQLDAAEADLEELLLDPGVTESDIEDAEALIEDKKEKLKIANDNQGKIQEPEYYYAEAMIGAKAMVPNFDDFGDYVVICAGPFLRGQCCWKEEGFHVESTGLGLNFDIDFNAQKGLTYVAQGTHWGRLGHELSHFFAGGDLYSSGTTAGTASRYAFMGNHDRGPLYIGYNMEKRLEYFEPNNVAKVTWGSSPTFNDTYDIVAHANSIDDDSDDVVNLLSLKVTEGMYYHVEVRQKPNATATPPSNYIFDQQLPLGSAAPAWEGGVLVSRAIEENNQNNNKERRIQLMPPMRLLQESETVNDPARTLKITVESKLSDRPLKYRVRVEWGTLPAADPDGQFDLRINPWTPPPWESIDIWANSTKNDETSPAKIIYEHHEAGDETKPIGNGDAPWVNKNNSLYAHIYNNGSVPTPEDVKVSFYVNTPPGVGDDGNWAPFDEVNVGILPANSDTIVKASRNWVPSVGEHTCVKVFIHSMTGEITFDNNMAQENFVEFEAESGSPFRPIEFDVDIRNPYEYPVVMDMKARDVPKHWNVSLEHGSVYLQPKEVRKMKVVIWTNMDGSVITNNNKEDERKFQRKPLISIEGWVGQESHSFFPVGGMSALVQSVLSSEIEIKPYYEPDKIQGRGSITPKKAGVSVAIHAIDPDGIQHSTRSTTTSSGVFSFSIANDKKFIPGNYKVKAYILPGSSLAGSESIEHLVTVQ